MAQVWEFETPGLDGTLFRMLLKQLKKVQVFLLVAVLSVFPEGGACLALLDEVLQLHCGCFILNL